MSVHEYMDYMYTERMGPRDKFQQGFLEGFNIFPPIAKEMFIQNFSFIQTGSMDYILYNCGQYEARSQATLFQALSPPAPSFDAGIFKATFLTYGQAGSLSVYQSYHLLLFMACLIRWSRPISQGGLGLDGTYGGLRMPSKANVCIVM